MQEAARPLLATWWTLMHEADAGWTHYLVMQDGAINKLRMRCACCSQFTDAERQLMNYLCLLCCLATGAFLGPLRAPTAEPRWRTADSH